MYAVERLSSYITQGVYTVSGPFHPFGGAVDIIVVQQQDGSFKSSPWYVRFGKFQGVLKAKENVVNIRVNGVDAGLHMFLDHKGEAYFLEESDAGDGEFVTSPASSGDETDQKSANARFEKIQSCDYDDSGRRESVSPSEVGNGKIVARTRSKRARILGLMFGRRSMKGDEQSGNVERVSSLERAEIAADLLEMKWSTNLSGNNHRQDETVEQPSDINGADPVNASKEGSPLKPSLHDEVVNYHGEGLDDNFQTRIISTEYVEEITICSSPHLGLSEELLTDEMRVETDEFDVASSESFCNKDANEFHGEGRSERFEGSTSSEEDIEETTSHGPCLRHEEVVEIYASETIELGNKSEVVSDIVPVEIGETDITSRREILKNSTFDSQSFCSGLLSHDTQQALETRFGDFGEEEVNSFSYCETLESTAVRLDVSSDEAHDTLRSGQGEHFEPYVEVLNERVELTSEVKLQPESGACAGVENPIGCHHQSLELSTTENCSAFENPQAGCLSNEASEETTAFKFSTDSSDVAAAVQAVIGFASGHQVTDKDTVTEELVQEKETGTKQMKSPGRQSQVNVGSIKAEKTRALLSESLEDDQLQFSENDGFVCKGVPMGLPDDNASVGTEDQPLSNPESDLEEHELRDEDHKQSFGDFPEVSMTETCPISIPKGKAHLVGSNLSMRSLPNIRSYINDLERSNLQQPLSCSLNSDSEIYNKDVVKNSYTGSSNLEAGSGSNILQDQLASPAAAKASNAEEKVTLFNPAVELSLCKHLLYEGMGSDAARQAFDAEKVNMEKFSALGPSLVRNGKLVVRIGGHYFPWVAAAPIILGMVAFGQEHMFEPQGMIAVDRDDKNLNGDTSRAMVPSGGSWRLWPFGFKKSNTMSTVRSTPEGTDGKTADPKLIGDRDRQRANKKKVLSPTSDQLASLNLKEGRNVVTFSFSTAMLGQQQVDARIYLWKWNTRIVISDVDGTITKSDVLGQFMPLVGVDWSQTGVAPLFSAIKDNGYQLLFLSARAISQAYLTRQFLFNLKQDGKALPDGPVVISPDGLFPSLYREVIRRAPHEFKISCLEDIRALFPPDCNPFYAGFGNRDTDEISYLKVGIPKGKIFIINPKGEVAVNRRVDTKSYTSLRELVNGMFPVRSSAEQEEFNNWNFWKLPLLDVGI